MLRKLYLLIFLLVLSTLIYVSNSEKEIHFRNVNALVLSDKPLTVGVNTIVVQITKDGKPEMNAKVSFKSFMPAMSDMPFMKNEAEAKEIEPGSYEIVQFYSMSGTWQLHIMVTPKEGKKYRLKSTLTF